MKIKLSKEQKIHLLKMINKGYLDNEDFKYLQSELRMQLITIEVIDKREQIEYEN